MGNGRRDKVLSYTEEANFKAAIYDLSEKAAKQMLYAIIRILAASDRLVSEKFEEILDDAKKYSNVTKA